MTKGSTTIDRSDITQFWPFALGGLLAPFGANVLARWMPLPLAAGLSFLVVWALAFVLFQRSALGPDRSPAHMIAIGVIAALSGALVTGFIAYLVPWR